MGRLAWGLAVVWTILLATSLLWNVHQVRQTALELATTQVQLSYNKDLVYRVWAAGHGGVYVPVNPQTPPNPYLSHIPERDILTPSGRALTLMNPAYMTRQVHELAAQVYGIKGHLTSLKPIRPENAPDPWETKALNSFEAGTPEITEVVESAGEFHLRFMRPFLTEKACLKCHAAQGYKEGDIRGGISLDVPMKPFLAGISFQTYPLAAGHGLIWLLGLTGIIMGNRSIRHYLDERQQAEEALMLARDELDQRVIERTADLRLANEQLLWEIEERQLVENHLRESEARFTAFMGHLPGLATMRDMEGRYLFANRAWEELMNLKPGAWQGMTLGEIWPAKQAAALQKMDFEIIASGKSTGQVEKMEQEDGSHHLLTHRFPILDAKGLPFMVGSIAIDITARLRAEKALTAERQRFLDLLEHLPAYIYLQAPDYSIRFANRRFRERFGEPHGKTCYTLLWGRDEPCPDCPTFTVFNTGQPKEWELSAPDDRVYQVYDYPFVDLDGSPLVLEMGIDITDRKRAEEALNASEIRLRYLADQLLMAQENERKRLAAELHDELGHALLILKLHLSSIEKKMRPEQEDLKEEMRSQLDYINEVIQEIRRLYYDLSPGDVEDLGLTKALHNLITDFAGHVPEITWQVDLADLEGLFSIPVQTIIYRTMQEALTNIGKHGHPDAVTISATKEPGQVHFAIQDNGRGFDALELDSHGTGRGMGLVAMEERLNMVGGSFEIQSSKQGGTELSFTIPTLPEREKL
jgi:PAS domain S-box-containing protein